MNSGLLMWQEIDGKFVFRFQTDDENVHRHMSQMEGFKLAGQGVNIDLWIYRVEFSSFENAKKTLEFLVSRNRNPDN
jgi:hypothetical protein